MIYLRDIRLWLFTLLATLASIISAHGAWVFFGYLVDGWLALIFTAVIALGIVGLDAAATVERVRAKRWAYAGGMALFLIMEVLANYFAGQASFVSKVRTALAASPGADLLVITADYPGVTRALVVLFLSLASIAVAAFVFAAASRVQTLGRRADLRVLLAQRRALVRRLVRLVRIAADEATILRGDNERLRGEVVDLRARAVADQQTAAAAVDLRGEIERLCDEVAAYRAAAVDAEQQAVASNTTAADLSTQLAASQQETARLRGALEQARVEVADLRAAAVPVAPTFAALVAYAQTEVDRGRPLADVAREVGMKESTLRDRMKVAGNGHSIEELR